MVYTGNKLLIFTAIFIPIQLICVALRYLSRYLVEGPWGLDDVLVLTSLASQLSLAGVSLGKIGKVTRRRHTDNKRFL